MALGVDSQCFVVDETARTSELPQLAGFLAIRHQLELEGLPSQHNWIILLVYAMSKDIRHGRHCVSALHAHLVFVTKYRRKVFDADALRRLQAIFRKVCRDFQANEWRSRTRTLAHPLPAKALRVGLGQQPQRGFQSPAPYRTPRYGETLLEQCPVVAFLLRRQLWRGTAEHY